MYIFEIIICWLVFGLYTNSLDSGSTLFSQLEKMANYIISITKFTSNEVTFTGYMDIAKIMQRRE